ncbi:PKD-like domain-containing protein [Flavobacterium sp. LB3P21]|uniref:PKD-like domain-containing protein n=1 Tax=Flavobacterium sp. LB3P21 TaxID=3401719 RepID=UPI003AAF3061
MKKNYSRFNINLIFVLLNSKNSLLIVLIVFLFSLDNFAQSISNFNPINACANSGASVIITGTGFSGATSVTFNGIAAASFTIDSNTQITAILSASATTGFISITPASGSDIISSDTFTVNPILVPSVSIVASPASPICSGTSVTFTATPVNGGSTPTYQWYVAGIAVGTGPTYTTSTLANGNQVKVEMTSNATCTVPATVTSNIITMTVNTAVTPSVAIESTQTTFCEGTSVTFSVDAVVNGGLSPTYQWRINGAPVGNSSTFTSTILSNNDVITLDLTSSATCATPAMVSSNSIQVKVNPNLPASVSIVSDDADDTICAGTSVTFTATPTNAGTTPVYQWYVGATPVGSNSASYTTSSLTTGQSVSVVMTSNAVCAAGSPATSNAIATTVNPNLPASVSIVSDDADNSICAGTSVTFTATPTNGGTTPVYQWYVGATPVSSNSATYTTSSLTTGQSVSVVMISNAVCATGSPDTSNAIVTTVNPNLPTSVSIVSNDADNTICTGTSVTFTATSTNGGTTPAYQWYEGATPVGPNSTTYTTSGLTTGQSVSVVMTSNAVCATGSPATSNAIVTTVNPNLPVSVSIVSNDADNTICAGTSITFTATPTNGGTTPVYQWYIGATPVGSNSATYTTTGLTTGQSVSVVMTSNAVCATGSPATSNAIVTTVNPNLPASVSIVSNDADNIICAGTSVTFIATPTNGGTTPAYQWYVGATPVGSNSTTYTTSALTTGQSVSVVMTSNAVCATGSPDTSNTIVTTVNPNLPASVSIVSNDADNIICAGTSVTFTATSTNGGTTPAYQWYVGATPVGSNSSTYTTSALTTGQSVSVVMTSNAICASGSPATSNAIVTTVNPNLPVSVSIGATATTICAGTSVTFTATPTNGGTTPAYQWKVNGVNAGTNSNTFTTTTLTNGQIVTVILTSNTTPCATGNPATSNSITMTVNSLVTPSVSISSTSTSICSTAGTSVTFTATPTNGGSAPTYQWQRNGTNIGGATSSTYTTTSLANPSTITVIMTSNATCASPTTATSNSILMTVYTGTPSLPANAISGPTAVCPVTSTTYSVSAVASATLYTWAFPTGWVINSGQGTISVNATATGSAVIGNNQNITVQVSNPCGNGNTRTFNVDVNTFAAVNLGADISMCSGTSISLNPILTGNANALPTFTASSGTISGGPYPATYIYTPSISNGTVTINATSNDPVGGCNAGTDQLIITVNQTVVITSQPAATQTVCSGNNVSFSVTATGTGLTYQWRKGTTNLSNIGNISGANTATLTLTGVLTTDAATNYNVVITGTAPCNVVTSNNATLIVNEVVTISAQPAVNQTVCSGNSANFSVTATGTGLNYQWRKGTTNLANGGSVSGANTPTLSINPVVSGDAATDYNVVITGTAPCTAVTSNNAALIVNDAVVITSQPAATQTVCSGTNLSFSVTTTGTGLTYQWRKGTTNLSNVGNISGANTATLTLTGVLTTDAGSYNVIVSGASPCPGVTSSNAVLVVNQVVAISDQPAVTQTVCTGNSLNFSVTAMGSGLTYQWRKGTTNLTNGGAISGANTNTLTINPVVSGDTAADYNVVITGTAPCTAVTSNNAALIVNDAVVIISQPAATQTVCSGINASFSVTATGTGLTYQWRKGATNLSNIGNISGANTATLTLTGVLTTDAGSYNVIVSGTSPCAAVTSSNAVLVVNQVVVISAQPAVTQTVCTGNSLNFSVTATGTGLNYQWRKGTTNLTNGGSVSGVNTNTLTINPVVSGDAASDYNVVITGTAPCTAVTSNNAALIVNDAVVITSQPAATQTVCSGINASFSVTATGTGLTYQWRKGTTNLSNVGNISGANTATLTLTGVLTTDAGSYNVIVSGTSPCAAVTSSSAVLVVNQVVAISAQPAVSQTVCTGNSANFSVTATGTGLNYQWRKGTTNLANIGSVSGANTPTLTINPVVSGDAATDYNVVITGTSQCTAVTSNNAALIVNDAVVITSQPAATQTVCSGTNLSFSVTTTGTGLTYQWRKGATNLVNGGNISGANSPSLTISNVTTADAANNYNVVITGTGPCVPVTSNNAILLVNKKVVIGTQPSNVGICASSTAQFGVVASGDGLTYQWYKGTFPGIAVANTAFITGAQTNVLNFSQAFLPDDGVYYVVVSGASPCASLKSNEVTLNVDQSIQITTQPIAQTVCEGASCSFSVAANAGGDPITYQWRKNGTNISGATTATYTIATTVLVNAGNYDVVVSGPSGYTCPTVTSVSAALTVTPTVGLPTAITISAGTQPSCQITASTPTTTFATAATNSTSFNWSVSNPAAGTINSSGVITWATGFSGSVNIQATANGCNGPSSQVARTVIITPTVGTPTAITVSAGTEPSCQITASSPTTTFATTATNNTGFNWSVSNPAAGSINSSGVMTWTTGFSGSVNIQVTANGCNGPSAQVIRTVTVTPTVGTPTAITVSAGTQPSCQITASSPTTTFATTATNNTSFNWSVSNPAAGTINSSGVMTWTTGFSGSVNIQVTANGCNGTSIQIIRTVNVTPTVGTPTAITISAGTEPSCQITASSPTTTFASTATNSTSFNWSISNPAAGTISASGVMTWATGFSGSVNIQVTANGCNGTSTQVTRTVIVNPTPNAVATNSVQTICSASAITTMVLSGNVASTTFNWVRNNTGTVTGISNSGSGNISGSLTNTTNALVTVTFTITPTANGCSGTPITTTVLVNPTPNAVATNSAQTICSATAITTMVLSGNVASTTFNWTRNNIGTVTGIAASGTGDISGSLTNTTNSPVTVTFTITPIANSCNGIPITATVLVNPTPNAVATPASQTICSGTAITMIVLSGNVTSTTFNWNRNNTGTVTGIAASGSGNIGGSLTNTTNTPVTVTFTITPIANGCSGIPISVTVLVNPTPNAVATNSAQTICSASAITTMVLSGNAASMTFNWTRNNTGTVTGIPNSGNGDISGSLTNTTSSPITVTFTITPTANGCNGAPITTTVLVNPTPNAVATPASQTICSASAITSIILSGNVASTTFNWTRNNTGTVTGIAASGSGNISGILINTTSAPITVTFIITPTANGCGGTPITATVTVDATSVGGSITGYFSTTPTIISNLITACHLGNGTLNLSGFVGNILRWEYTTNGGVTWVPIANISTVNNFTNISQTTLYRAVIKNGTCGLAYSALAYVNVIPPNIKPDPVSASPSTLCLGSSSLFTSQSSYGTGQFLQGGDFQTGQLNTQDPRGWLVDGSPGGYTASANNTSSNHWAGTNPHPFPGGIIYDSGDPKFAIANGPLTSTLQTPIFNSLGLTTFSFGFDQAYKLLTGDRILIELSLNGGASYTVTLQDITGPAQSALFNTFANDNTSFDLQNYIGQTQLRVKFTFIGANTNSAWALDNFKFPDAPPNQTIEWTDEDGNIISTTNTASITPVSPGVQVYGVTTLINGCRSSGIDGTEFVTVNVNFAYAGKDLAIVAADCGNNTVTLNAYDNRLTAAQNIAKGAWDNNYITDTAIGTGATGKWTIKSSTAISPCNTATFLPNDTDPNATFTGDAGTYVLTWTAAGCSDDVSVVLRDCATINFDGANDNITFKDNYDFTAPFSIEVWVKPNAVTGTQTIFSKRDSNNLSTGYDLKLTGDKISFNWNGAGTIISNNAISTNRWYHIAVTFSGATYRLYIDGIEVKNESGILPTTNNFDCILGAMNRLGSQPVSYFNGWMDEVKIWNKALTPEQLHQIMNQEIKSNGTAVSGVIIPVDVNGLSWTTDLLGYYQMSSISCGYLNPTKGTAVGKLRNITSAQEQTAPIPYTSRVNGQDWSTDNTWTYFNVWDAPNSLGVDNSTPIDWNIVQISHNINSGNKDITVLGLLSTAGKLTIADPVVTTPIENNDGQGLWVTLYLLLNGNIDLVGESQLVQKRYTATQYDESILDETSTGYIERDQQGKKNSFNYNYWSSPVSIQGNLNNSPFAISNVLKDGTNSLIPSTIDFNDGAFYADVVSNPIKISNRWLWSYNSQTLNSNTALDDYYQWKYVGSTGLIKTGEGYTMKGTGGIAPITALQNYVFIGKPNSGTITLTIPYNQTYLVGNPYPSAMDANSFIRDNLKDCSGCTNTVNVFNGALYFWDHFGLSNNHDLAEYEGGYATYTLMGGVAGIADSPLTATGAGTKVPQRYIPVGQGFFVDAYQDSQLTGSEIPASVTGGTLFFKNSQRVFVKESLANSLFMKTSGTTKSNAKDTDAETETRSKIRLGFDSSLGVHRQLLLGADSSTTSMFDIGYDAPMFDLSIDDMFWEINNIEYVIQAVTDFNENQIIPLSLTVGTEGKVKIKIDTLENISNSTEIYLHDNVTGIYHNIRNSDFTISLAVGEYRNRFSLRFTNKTLDVDENNLNDGLIVLYSNNYKVLIIQNKALNSTVDEVRLFNLLGQAIANWDVKNENQTKIQIPIKNLSSGVYIIKLKTSKGAYSKKIIIK